MTVKELIKKLQKMPPDARVVSTYDYGDHVHTDVCEDIEVVGRERISWSEYHQMSRLNESGDEEAVILK